MKMLNNFVSYVKNEVEVITMAIVSVYVTLIIAGRRKFAQVPKNLQPAVKADLEAMGLDENGNPIVEAYLLINRGSLSPSYPILHKK